MTDRDGRERLVERIIQDVAELPDRTSPDDWPDAMLVTADELRSIVRAALTREAAPPAPSDEARLTRNACIDTIEALERVADWVRTTDAKGWSEIYNLLDVHKQRLRLALTLRAAEAAPQE